jgi:lactate permease
VELLVNFLLALVPIICLVVALIGFKMATYRAALLSLAVSLVVAIAAKGMAPVAALTAALEGFLFALWPIVVVIIAAVFTYNITVHTGAIETLKTMLASVSSDSRVVALLLAWCFGGFLEGMAGFGTAVAIPASMLIALGMNPALSVMACLVANGVPTMFGSIGIPTTTLASITGLDVHELAFMSAVQAAPFVLLTPFFVVIIAGGGLRALKGALPVTLVAGVSYALGMIAGARFISAEMAMVVASVVALAAVFGFAMLRKGAEVPEEYYLEAKSRYVVSIDLELALRAWAPFILIFVVLLLVSVVAPLADVLNVAQTKLTVYAGDDPATLTFKWINTPGVLVLICGFVGGFIQGCEFGELLGVLADTAKQMSKTVLTMLGVVGLAKVMGYSGMIADIAAFFVGTLGGLYPLVAPLLGAVGTFVTGSGTSSELLFGNVQVTAARQLGVNELWLASSNSLGISAGKMISPQNIAIGTATSDELSGKDGEILGKVFPYAAIFCVLMAAYVFALASMLPA